MKKCWKASDGEVFDTERDCIKYEKQAMIKEHQMEELHLLYLDKRLDTASFDWSIVRYWDEIYDIMVKNKYPRTRERKEHFGKSDKKFS